ncbi:M20/M25/M40 family metallo-hydrolase [Haloarchaeobius iranensis]|uniref:Endoglucanase n=1 Tax=Haloarchaeobius iranensis TaxID=996166 RepID=A0A1G9Z6F7_9EURY|nr:M20/M25/M40 family metallo-hydrolase [Haloarchaeobius iranensis]SDN16737.1 endoglucanase [Haloarchaeobius iranensis]
MDDTERGFLTELLETPSPSGYETRGQRIWVEYVEQFADEVRTDAYGNAVAVAEGSPDAPTVAFTGHADEIGFSVNRIDDDGFLHLAPIGGSDRTVSKGQHVTVHTGDGPVSGVVTQTAIHLRERDGDEFEDISQQTVDIGAADGEAARETVEVGDPITFSSGVEGLMGSRLAGRALDNRVGTWAAAEALRRAVAADVDATVYAVSTVQEEVGAQGAKMVATEVDADAVVVVDVSHVSDYPGGKADKAGDTELGGGPIVGRGGANHPVVAQAVRKAAADADIAVQLQADPNAGGTDARSFYTARGGVPTLNLGVPNRYMHTPVEVIDTDDLDAVADLLAAFADQSAEYETFGVDV